MLLLSLCASCFTGCGDDEDVKDPVDAVTLNMLNEDNGKTRMGTSDVYINKSNNFKTSSAFIMDAGNAAGVGVKIEPRLDNLAQEVAVSAAHLYLIFDGPSIRTFPSGKQALQIGAGYYKAYVVSPITDNSSTTGAVVKYVLSYLDAKGLPENGKILGTLNQAGDKVEFTLPQDAEFVFTEHSGSGESEAFDVQTTSRKLTITLLRAYDRTYGPYGTYEIYIRSGNAFTVAEVNVGI